MASNWDEQARLAALHAYAVLDTPREAAFDDIVELAAHICGTPMSLVSLVDEHRQWFKARKGLDATQTPRVLSVCATAMLEAPGFQITDATRDPRTADNPLVRGEPNIRFYAGAPLLTPDGLPLGMLCVLDDKVREGLSDEQHFALRTLAGSVMSQLELRRTLHEQSHALSASQESLRQAQKMEAVGQLTGGLAHDFNNLLQGIASSVVVARRLIQLERIGEVDHFLAIAARSAERAAALTHRLLAFSRQQPLSPEPLQINDLLVSMRELLARACGESITLRLDLAPDLWLAICDANQLENAVLNLAINARDAMPDGGMLIIGTANVTTGKRAGQLVCVRVIDDGTGMPDEVKKRAFDPFYTTKPTGVGTGLGLSMVYGFAQQSGGDVGIDSELGVGTTISVCLPRFSGALATQTSQRVEVPGEAGGSETILVSEDDPAVRELATRALIDLGYSVLTAVDGPSALALLQSTAQIDALVTDVGLPGMNGRQIAELAMRLRPRLKVLFMTGYAETVLTRKSLLPEGTDILSKPFELDELARRLRILLDSMSAAR